MSKSLGNVIPPKQLVDTYGVDPVRYFLLRELPFGNDGDFSHRAVVARLNSDLANDFGNLAQRVLVMINRDCGAAIPDPGALAEADRALLDGARELLETVRNHMKEQAFHLALETIWRVVSARPIAMSTSRRHGRCGAATRLGCAPCFIPSPRRSGISRFWCNPLFQARQAKLLDQLGVPPGARDFAALAAAPLTPGNTIAEARGDLSAVCRGAGGMSGDMGDEGRAAMLVDSHCHLDFPDFARRAAGGDRPRPAAGVGTMLTIGTRLDQFPGCARSPKRRDDLVLGRRPSARGRRSCRAVARAADGAGGASQSRRNRRDRARFPLRSEPARHPGAGVSRPYRGFARDRLAADRPRPRGRRRDRPHPRRGTAAARCAALLFERPRPGRGGAGARLLHLDFGDRDLQERRGVCARSCATCRSTACWSRPTAPISRRCRIAASATSRLLSRRRRRRWQR